MKVCIFAGSGFSKAIFDQAIQNEFCEDFLNSEESKVFVDYLSDKLKRSLERKGDIEKVMSDYFCEAYPVEEPSDSKSYNTMIECRLEIIYFRMALAIYFREKFKSIGIPKYQEEYKDLMCRYFKKLIREYSEVIIITTNYDLGFEQILEDCFGKSFYYYPGWDESGSGKIPVLKTHGSINWLEDRDNVNRHFQDFTRTAKLRKTDILNELEIFDSSQLEGGECKRYTEDEIRELSLSSENEIDHYDIDIYEFTYKFTLAHEDRKYSPILVPFLHQKEQWAEENKNWHGELFDAVWEQTKGALREADQLIFLGYGLPEADKRIRSLIKKTLKDRQPKCDIVDLGDQDSTLIKLANSVYKKNKEDNKKIFKCGVVKYIECEFRSQ